MANGPKSPDKEVNVLLISPLEGDCFPGGTESIESVIRSRAPIADSGEPVNVKFRVFNQDNLGDLDLGNVPETHVIISGSDRSIHDPLPHRDKIADVIQMVRGTGKKLLGICWGHQFIVEKLGGEVYVAEEYPDKPLKPEFGIIPLSLTRKGMLDMAFRNLKTRSEFYMTHFDRVKEPPHKGKVIALASSDMYKNQVLRIDGHIVTTQMHPELNGVQVAQLITATKEKLLRALSEEQYVAMLKSVREDFSMPESNGRLFMHNFYLGPIEPPDQLVLDFVNDTDSEEEDAAEAETKPDPKARDGSQD